MHIPIAHLFAPPLPGEPDLESIKLARDLDRFEANAAERAEMGRNSGWQIATFGAVIFIASLGFLAAADWGLSRAEQYHRMEARV